MLILPGVMGVFDGATSSSNREVDGITPGRLASETVAAGCAELFVNGKNFDLPANELMQIMSSQLSHKAKEHGFHEWPATTLALVLFNSTTLRFLINGDSGIRINKDRVLRHEKVIDSVSAAARVMLFRIKSKHCPDPDQVETETRQAIFRGLSTSVTDKLFYQADVDHVLATTVAKFVDVIPSEEIENFLLGGIRQQYNYANRGDCALGFSTLNGSDPMMRDVIDLKLPRQEIQSVELFSDGYFTLPEHATVESWETAHEATESRDFHKIGLYSHVKGSTSKEFTDDRSVIVARLQ